MNYSMAMYVSDGFIDIIQYLYSLVLEEMLTLFDEFEKMIT
jgi:hypothetical protein